MFKMNCGKIQCQDIPVRFEGITAQTVQHEHQYFAVLKIMG